VGMVVCEYAGIRVYGCARVLVAWCSNALLCGGACVMVRVRVCARV